MTATSCGFPSRFVRSERLVGAAESFEATLFNPQLRRDLGVVTANIALDLGVDTSTPAGEMMASVLATFAQFERRLIGQRTKDALAIKRAQGVQLGRPRTMSEETVERIRELKRLGMSASDIAHELNAEGVPTATGRGRWHPPGVARALSWVRS